LCAMNNSLLSMKKSMAFAASFCLLATAPAQTFELVTEFKYVNVPYGVSIRTYESPGDGVAFQYSESTKGGYDENGDVRYVSNKGKAVPLFSQEGKIRAFTKPEYFQVGDVHAGKLVVYNPRASKIVLQIRYLESEGEGVTLTPDFSAISVYQNIKRAGLETMNGSLSWNHSYSVQSVFEEHVVLRISSQKKGNYYDNPAIVRFDNPTTLRPINPELPADEKGESDTRAVWHYQGSTADKHFYFKGLTQKKKNSYTNMVAVADNSGKIVNSFSIDMNMPGMKLMKYNNEKLNEGFNPNVVDYKSEQCIYMMAMGRSDNNKDYLIVKKVSFDGKLLWEKTYPIAKHTESEDLLTSASLDYDYDNAPVFGMGGFRYPVDAETGELKNSIKTGNPNDAANDPYPHLDKNIKTLCANFKRENKEVVKLYYLKKVGNTWFALFTCKKDMARVYKFTVN
jgi:hypothetical protein